MSDSLHVKINLIGKPQGSLAHDFLKWSINVGRVIIVATELIALGALGYRFYMDRKIIDLHDQINREQLFIKSQASKEEGYRSVQNRLDIIKQTETNTKMKIDIMNSILQTVATGAFSSTNLTIDQSSVGFSGVAFSIFPVNTFIEDLKKNPNVTSISLDDVSSTTGGIQFRITVELKNGNG